MHLTQKTLQNHASQEVQIIVFTGRTLVKLPRPSSKCISEKPPSLKDVILQKQCVPFDCYKGRVGRCSSGQTVGLDARSEAQKSAEFLLHVLKNAGSSRGWCGSVDWVSACKPKGCQFNSQSGHMPRLQAMSPVGVAQVVSFPLSVPPSLSKNK